MSPSLVSQIGDDVLLVSSLKLRSLQVITSPNPTRDEPYTSPRSVGTVLALLLSLDCVDQFSEAELK